MFCVILFFQIYLNHISIPKEKRIFNFIFSLLQVFIYSHFNSTDFTVCLNARDQMTANLLYSFIFIFLVWFNVAPTQYRSYGDFTVLLMEENLRQVPHCTLFQAKNGHLSITTAIL
jgi:hypothetical protein